MNRRNILQAGLVATTAGLSSNTLLNSALADTHPTKTLNLDHFIFDDRFTECRNVAAFFQQVNVIKHKVSGDITELWYQHLDGAWKNNSTTVAGITTESALFYLQRLAWIHQVRLTYHGYHPVPINGKVQHGFKDQENLISTITEMNERSWSSNLGNALVNSDAFQSKQKPIKTNINLLETEESTLKPRGTILVSWILSPLSSTT